MTTRVAVTGASGNLGTALLRRLATKGLTERGDVDVVAIARRVPPAAPPYDVAVWHSMDLSDPACEPRLAEVLDGVDAVVHLVWGFQPTRDADYLERVGPGASRRVLDAAHRAGVSQFVHMSSVGAYAPKVDDVPVDESYPHTGMPTSIYSTHKAIAERRLDEYEAEHPAGMTVARVRPGIVLQRDAGAALGRYGLPAYLPARLLRMLPVLPVDRALAVPVVHSDDVADAVARILDTGAAGAFNVASDDVMTREVVAQVLGARPVHVPARALRAAAAAAWHLRLQPLSPGWLDLGFAVPLQDSTRARAELGWASTVSARDALAAAVDGIVENAHTASPALRPRSVLDRVRRALADGPIGTRHRP